MELLLPILILVLITLSLWRQAQAESRLRSLLEAPRSPDPGLSLLKQDVDALRGQVQQSLDALRGQVQQSLGDTAGGTQSRMNEVAGQLLKQLSDVQTALDSRLKASADLMQQSTAQVGQRLDSATKVVGEVQIRLGTLEGASQRIYELGKDLSGLQEVLRSQKARGVFGEQMLENLLLQILPRESVSLQHGFKDGEKVDALVQLAKGQIAIDAKFPLENYLKAVNAPEAERAALWGLFGRDVRKHVDDISKKYIRPDEGTLDFALMYIPSESVYYETAFGAAANKEGESIVGYAQKKRVVLSSPNTLFAYLQTVLIGLKGLRIEEEAEAIRGSLARLRSDLDRFNDIFGTVGKHLRDAGTKYSEAEKKLEKFSERLDSVAEPARDAPAIITPQPTPESTPGKPPTKPGERDLWRIA